MDERIYGTGKSVCAIIAVEGGVLLTWQGSAAGRQLALPGGVVRVGEAPEEALMRCVRAQTGLSVRASALAGVHFGGGEWRVAFNCAVEGGAPGEGAVRVSMDEALRRRDVNALSRLMLAGSDRALERDAAYDVKNAGCSLYL